jgi:uncharacterized membrane protein
MLSDFKYIFTWWLSLFFLSSLSLPLMFLLFQKFWDKGYIFAKTFSLFVLSYLLLTLGIFHLSPFTLPSIYFILALFAAINIFLVTKKKSFFKNIFRRHWRIFLFEEILFLTILTLWSYVRGFAPDIEGLEKFMDWGFVNSILRSQFFPPADMWYAGQSINYYYFGHFVFAFLTKFSGISSAITYNLSIATVCALTFLSGFSLTSNLIFNSLKKPLFRLYFFGGLLSAFLLTFGGNLHTAYKIGKGVIVDNLELSQAASLYWYPDATRFIGFDPDTTDKTIHEFPLYSFVVADLHGHMNDIPLVIFFIAFLFVSLTSILNLRSYLFLPAGFLLSLAYMTNAWDFAVYGLLFGLSSLLLSKSFWKTLLSGLFTIAAWFLFTLPFSLHFSPMAEGLKIADAHTPLYQLFILYGGFWLISLPFVVFFLKNLKRKKILPTDYFVFALFTTATVLVIIPEIIYIKDIYISEYRRANTMFKLVYQAFIMYSLISGYVFIRLRHSFFYRLIFSLVFIIHLSYSYFAIKSYYGLKNYKGLWGLNFLKTAYPDNLAAINWLNQNVPGQPNIVEATGDSYTTFNQISMATGLPTIEGWLVHEWLWRGGYEAPAARVAEVEKIYTSSDFEEIKNILDKYQIKYIFVGDKEYEKYPNINPENFKFLNAKIVFESGQTRIYQLP